MNINDIDIKINNYINNGDVNEIINLQTIKSIP